ncbi:MAG: Zn-dependent oligopeptidase [Phycisphaerales bacterium]|nr:Zn-dependent oligopeptidase [Phycisphaerales bacterium]
MNGKIWCVALAALIAAGGSMAAAQPVPADSPAREALQRAVAAVDRIVATPDAERTFDNTLGAIDDLFAQLEVDTNMLQFMQYVSTDAAERERSQLAEKHIQEWLIEVSKREDLYRAVRSYADKQPKLEGEQKKLLENTLRDYRRAGMALPPEKREELTRLQKQVVDLAQSFEKRIREDASFVLATEAELRGMDESYVRGLRRGGDAELPAAIREKIEPADAGKFVITMDGPTFFPLMDFCEDEGLRKRAWIVYKRRGGLENVATLEQILKLRAQASQLLGYSSTADFETEPRMSKNAANVRAFYDKLRPIVRKKARQDFDLLRSAKAEHAGDAGAKLFPWDQAFYKNRVMKARFSVDGQRVREYFPLDRVIEGLFATTQALYGLEYREVTAEAGQKYGQPLWHADVRVYDVYDRSDGRYLGAFYIDLFPRENKYNHAAQWGLRQHKIYTDGRRQTPLAALVCNFTKPLPDKPSLMTHDEVETFFHEFGHCLHTILSDCRYNAVSGTNVARDFVEAPSQMFENWVWNVDVLNTFAAHYRTGEKFPAALLKGMLKAKNVASGLEAERQIFYAMTDLEFHSAPDGVVNTNAVQERLFGETELYEPVAETWYHASFGHLVGYQAGYYGYMWSQVYGQDMFSRFRELGINSPDAGRYYRQKILSRGGSVDELEMVREYLGREPKMDAFLAHLGLEGEQH